MTDFWPEPPEWLSKVLSKHIYEDRGMIIAQSEVLKSFSASSVRYWITRICWELDIAPSKLALQAGLAASTLNRFLRNDTDSEANLSSSTLHKIREAVTHLAKTSWTPQNAYLRYRRRLDKFYRENKRTEISETRNNFQNLQISEICPSGPYCEYPMTFQLFDCLYGLQLNRASFLPIEKWSPNFYFECSIPLKADYFNQLMICPVYNGDGLPFYKDGATVIGAALCTSPRLMHDGMHVIAFQRRNDGRIACGLWEYVEGPQSRIWLLPLDRKESGILLGRDQQEDLDRVYVSHRVVGELHDTVIPF